MLQARRFRQDLRAKPKLLTLKHRVRLTVHNGPSHARLLRLQEIILPHVELSRARLAHNHHGLVQQLFGEVELLDLVVTKCFSVLAERVVELVRRVNQVGCGHRQSDLVARVAILRLDKVLVPGAVFTLCRRDAPLHQLQHRSTLRVLRVALHPILPSRTALRHPSLLT